MEKGIIRWRNGKVINHYTINNGLRSNEVNTIDQAKDGQILVEPQKDLAFLMEMNLLIMILQMELETVLLPTLMWLETIYG